MISATFVGLCLTSIPSVIRVFQRPFRPDVLLAPRFPAWLDAAHGPVSLPSDEVVPVLELAESDERVAKSPGAPYGNHNSPPEIEFEFEFDEGLNSLKAHSSMNGLLFYHHNVEDIAEVTGEDVEVPCLIEEVNVFCFGDHPDVDEQFTDEIAVEQESQLSSIEATGLRADAPEFKPTSIKVAPVLNPIPSALHPDPAAFIPRNAPKSSPSSPLRKNAPDFRPRNALTIAYEFRRPADVVPSRDALTLACASRVGFVTPRQVLHLKAPRSRKSTNPPIAF